MRELVRDASWCWFGDARALYYNNMIYYGWHDSKGRVWVAQLDPASGTRRRYLVDTYLNASGNPQVDDHGNPSLVIRGGKLCVFWSYHAGSAMKYRIADAVESVESFGPIITCSAGNSAGGNGFTYPNPVDFSSGGIGSMYLFWRGGNFQPTYSKASSLGGNQWSPAKHLFSAASGVRPYMKVLGDPVKGWVHFAMTDGHPRDVSTSIYYARLQVADGTIRRANGGLVGNLSAVDAGSPIPVSSLDKVYDGATNPRGWIWDLQIDATGNPALTFATVPSRTAHAYHAARFSGGAWSYAKVCDAGGTIAQDIEDQYSGGIVLDPTDLNTVVVSRQDAANWHRIESWATTDNGATWSRSEVVSDAAEQNVRPFFVRGAPATLEGRLLWLRGSYGTFVDFGTDLVTI